MERIKLHTNPTAQKTLINMRDSGRLPHSFLITGKTGSGKKTFAKYLTQMILCEHPDIAPCGECNACHKVAVGEHPDVVYAEHSGKLGGFSADFLRDEIVAKAYIKPNDGEYRVYVFEDCNNFQARTQNTLLKLIEEPPKHAKFIFTATGENVFLPTILSRTTHIELFDATTEECVNALKDAGISEHTAMKAIEACGNNLGKCFEYVNGNGDESGNVLARAAADAIADRNEYLLNATLFSCSNDRNTMLSVLENINLIIRDAAVKKADGSMEPLSAGEASAVKLGKSFSTEKLIKIRQCICECIDGVLKNCSRPLMASAVSAKISEIF